MKYLILGIYFSRIGGQIGNYLSIKIIPTRILTI